MANPMSLESLSAKILKGMVFVITGGSNGIGEALVRLLVSKKALVVFGDMDAARGELLATELSPNAQFIRTDAADYIDILALFDLALDKHGHIDCAVANAGILERGDWFGSNIDLENVRTMPDCAVLDVNLRGMLYFSRIAMPYLRHKSNGRDRNLILMSSVAGFKETPGLFVYQTAKHGVIGLMRSLRLHALPALGVRVNCICPWATETSMTAAFSKIWAENNLPMNSPLDIANNIVAVAVDESMNGKSIYIEGGRGWEIEDNLDRLQSQWLGEEPSASLNRGQTVLGIGSKWDIKP